MKLVQTMLFALCLSVFFSFAPVPSEGVVGTFGVSAGDPSEIELTLREDHTFAYQDFSDPEKKINIRGNWELKKNSIVLHAHASEHRFHDRWKMEEDGMAITSVKGMTFYRLGRLDK